VIVLLPPHPNPLPHSGGGEGVYRGKALSPIHGGEGWVRGSGDSRPALRAAASARQQHLVDDVDHAVRLVDIGGRHGGDAALLVLDEDHAVLGGGDQQVAGHGAQVVLPAPVSMRFISAAASSLPATTW